MTGNGSKILWNKVKVVLAILVVVIPLITSMSVAFYRLEATEIGTQINANKIEEFDDVQTDIAIIKRDIEWMRRYMENDHK